MSGRILIVGPYPPPYGGIATQIANTTPYLLDAGFERVHIVSWAKQDEVVEKGPLITEKVDLLSKSAVLADPRNWKVAASMMRLGRRHRLSLRRTAAEMIRASYLLQKVRTGSFDIIHYFMLSEGIVAPALRASLPGLKQAITIYGEIFEDAPMFADRAELVAEELAVMDHRMSSSRYCARSVETLGIPSDNIEPLYYGVDLDRFSPKNDPTAFRQAAGIRETAKVVLFFARLLPEMGADIVADLLPAVLDATSDVVFVIAGGDGECAARFRELQARYPDRIHLRVNVPGSDVPAMYAACDLLIAPTRERHACMGMSIKEAMATARVGVCSRSGGIPEAVVDGETGILLPTGPDLRVKVPDLAEAVLRMVKDDAHRRRMGESARVRAEQMFDNRRTAARLVEIYRALLAG